MRRSVYALACLATHVVVACGSEPDTATGDGSSVTVAGGAAGAKASGGSVGIGGAGTGGASGGGAAGVGGKTPPVAGFAGAAHGGAAQAGGGGAAGTSPAGQAGAPSAGQAGAPSAGQAGAPSAGQAGAAQGGGGQPGTAASGGTGGVIPGPACNGDPFPQGVPDPDGFIASAASYQDTDPKVDAAVNAAMAKLTGCSPGSDCPITGLPGSNADEVCQSWFAAVTAELRAQGFCAGQHTVGSTDEIAVGNISCNAKWYGYHVCFYGGPKVVWNPGARRGWWMIAEQYCP